MNVSTFVIIINEEANYNKFKNELLLLSNIYDPTGKYIDIHIHIPPPKTTTQTYTTYTTITYITYTTETYTTYITIYNTNLDQHQLLYHLHIKYLQH